MRILFVETGLEGAMAEDGSELAWRLLAALEGGALALLAAAVLAHARRPPRTATASAPVAPCNSVLITNTENELGKEIKQRLEARGCTVVTSDAIREATSGAEAETVDALVVVGADRDTSDINAISRLVAEDVYDNLKLMETLSHRVRKGGAIAWACAGSGDREGVFSGAGDAFDTALQASLTHTARVVGCAAVWVGRQHAVARTAERLVQALTEPPAEPLTQGFSVRNAAYKISGYLCRWLKIAS